MACMQFELFGVDRVQVETAVVYVDHNILQIDFKNPDDHRFLQAMAARYGLWFSRPGNGICHYVHCERFAIPGKTLIGADSHTTQSGSCAMIAIGAGGLDVAVCMAGHPFELPCPDRKSTRLNSSHSQISYAVFCLKKKKIHHIHPTISTLIRTDARKRLSSHALRNI